MNTSIDPLCVLFLMTPRMGSSYLTSILLGETGTYEMWQGGSRNGVWRAKPGETFLKTLPRKQCRFEYGDEVFLNFYNKRIKSTVSKAFTWNTPGILRPDFFKILPGNNWKFIYLLRNPMNWIESYINYFYKNNGQKTNDQVFENLCLQAKNKFECALENANNNRFYYLKFEDLIQFPLINIRELFRFLCLKPDILFFKKHIKDQTEFINTGYDNTDSLNRYQNAWTVKKYKKFLDIFGLELLNKFNYKEV